MTATQVENILEKLADEKYIAFKEQIQTLINQIKIKRNFLGDRYWIHGRYSIGMAKVDNLSKDGYTYTLKFFIWDYTAKSKQCIEEANYLKELEHFVDLMLATIINDD